MIASSPTMLKRWIALELRKLRETAGLSRQDVAQRLGRAVSHIGHIETMRNLPSPAEMEVLLDYYNVSERAPFFLEILTGAKKNRDWWTELDSSLPPWFDLYLAMESSAARIDSYDMLLIPGLVQTPEYAEAVIRGGGRGFSNDQIAERIKLRIARQAIFIRDKSPRLQMVLDEAALRRQVGGPVVMRNQLCHLMALTKQAQIDLRVLLASTGAHPAQDGSFMVISFHPELGSDSVVYLQTRIQGIYYEEPAEVSEYQTCLNRLCALSESPEDSLSIITRIAQELEA